MSDSNSILTYDKPAASHDDRDDVVPLTKRATICGDNDEYVMLGDQRYLRHELMFAFGGRFQSEKLAPAPVHKFGNVAALGMFSFALNSFILGLYNLKVKGIQSIEVAVSMMFFCGGLLQFLSGVWEMVIGNTFAAFAMCSFGCFYISTGALYVPAFGMAEAYATAPEQFPQAMGFVCIGWAITAFICVIILLRSTIPLILIFVSACLSFLTLGIQQFTHSEAAGKASAVFSICVGVCGFYNGFAGVANSLNSYIKLPVLSVPW